MCATYVPFHQLPSGGLSGSFRKFSCARCTYHFTSYQVGDFPVPSGNFRVRDVHTISPATKWGTFRFLQEIFVCATYVPFHQLPSGGLSGSFRKFSCARRTYHFTSYQVGDFPVPSGNFRVRDVRTISPATKWGIFRFLQEIFVCATYVPFHQLPSGGRSGSFRKFSCARRTYHAQPTIVGLAQARPNQNILVALLLTVSNVGVNWCYKQTQFCNSMFG